MVTSRLSPGFLSPGFLWFTQTQSSRTALRRSRKWMSGHADADALTQFVTDPKRQIVQQFVGPTAALQKSLPSAGEVLFSLDKPLSWMSPGFPLCRLAGSVMTPSAGSFVRNLPRLTPDKGGRPPKERVSLAQQAFSFGQD
jgi:hypothetical protein